jgi:hypothetical protein
MKVVWRWMKGTDPDNPSSRFSRRFFALFAVYGFDFSVLGPSRKNQPRVVAKCGKKCRKGRE